MVIPAFEAIAWVVWIACVRVLAGMVRMICPSFARGVGDGDVVGVECFDVVVDVGFGEVVCGDGGVVVGGHGCVLSFW